MSDLILVTGGARSGKSTFAQNLFNSLCSRLSTKAFIATAVALDDEIRDRIERHKAERKSDYDVFEEPENLSALLCDIIEKYDFILIDCITFYLSNLVHKGMTDDEILEDCRQLISTLHKGNASVVAVSNELGQGIVPPSSLGRRFRDLQGWVNQMLARESKSVHFVVSGIPMKIK